MRLIIVSNRLPVSASVKNDKLQIIQSSGGVATGISTYLNSLEKNSGITDNIWVGWPGLVPEKHRDELNRILEKRKLRPVFLSESQVDNYYNGFSNDTIWPLFHYLPSYVIYKQEYWDAYRQVNEIFTEELGKVLKPGDLVWVHDYQLMLLPKLLRDKFRDEISIGFFLHIPFPFFEIFRLLPDKWRRAILNGMLGADQVGFHTYDYTQNFHSSVQRLLGFDHDMENILMKERKVRVDTFPMGIDFKKFNEAFKNKKVIKEKQVLHKTFGKQKVILSIDRLDYTKGIGKRLQGYEKFLEDNQQWHKKIVLALIVVPSRTEVDKYQEMKKQIDELVGKINGKFGTVDWNPINYQFKSLNFEQLTALYSLSDIALVTPLRDGMNLIAKEYVAARHNQTGVLILSETAGTAQELGEATLINPNHTEEISEAIEEALKMPIDAQKQHMQNMQFRLNSYNIVRWAKDFIDDLVEFKTKEKKEREQNFLGATLRGKIAKEFEKAKNKLLFLDYDGTLVPFADHPSEAQPTQEVIQVLKKLSKVKNVTLVIISGRDRDAMDLWFKGIKVAFVAEHGIWIKKKDDKWGMIKPFKNEWKKMVIPIVKTYVDRVPGSFLEEKDFALVWHYRMANPWLARMRAKELTNNLVNLTANMEVQVMRGNKVIEIKNSGANKGDGALSFLDKETYDFVLAIGDDVTDEDLFKAMPEKAYTIKVGVGQSRAKYILDNHSEVLHLLDQLATGKNGSLH